MVTQSASHYWAIKRRAGAYIAVGWNFCTLRHNKAMIFTGFLQRIAIRTGQVVV